MAAALHQPVPHNLLQRVRVLRLAAEREAARREPHLRVVALAREQVLVLVLVRHLEEAAEVEARLAPLLRPTRP